MLLIMELVVFLKEKYGKCFLITFKITDKIDAMIISDCRDNQLKKVTILDITQNQRYV